MRHRIWLSLFLVMAIDARAATFVVINTALTGAGSLDSAIQNANQASGEDLIEFDIPGPGPHVIATRNRLRQITEAVTIDGYTQAGSTENSLVEGSNATLMIEIDGTGSAAFISLIVDPLAPLTLRGLAIHGFGFGLLSANGSGAEGDGFVLEGSYLGLRADGSLGTVGRSGITFSNGSNVRIGGPTPQQRNVIANFSESGITHSDFADGVLIEGNYIGLRRDGVTPAGGPNGVLAFAGGLTVRGNRIGGNTTGIFATQVVGSRVSQVRISGNEFLNNAGLGIDLSKNSIAADGVSANDEDDDDVGPNGLQNFPELDSVSSATGSTMIVGSLDRPDVDATYRLEFFANAGCDGSGHGEGEVFLGGVDDVPFTGGADTFEVTLNTEAPSGAVVTSTATDAAGNTSEFSACKEVIGSGVFTDGFEAG